MTWTISAGTGITLPLEPSRVTEVNPAVVDVFQTDGDAPVIIVPGLDAQSLVVEGWIYVAGQTNAQLESNYLAPLRAMRGKEVAVTSPDSQYNGNWVLISFDPRRVPDGAIVRYYYSLKLLRGQANVIL